MAVKHLRIHGMVQGVGYRWSMARQAQMLGVTGWVRNRRDGTVEAMIAGTDSQLVEIVEWARRGPFGAAVSGVDSDDGDGEFFGFEQLPTV